MPSSISKPARIAIHDRPEPIFGVCEALGDDFGFNPNWLRFGLAPFIFWNPFATFAAYFAVGAVVLAVRLLFPDVRASEQVEVERVEAEQELQLAA